MIKDHFDNWEFQHASSLIKTDPLLAKIEFEEYIKKYPNDYYAYPYYAGILITIGELDKVEKIIEHAENNIHNNIHYTKHNDRFKSFNDCIIYTKLRLLSYQEKYEELYELCIKNMKIINDLELNSLLLLCQKKLNKLNTDLQNSIPYLHKQIIDYKESDFLKHIRKHMANYNQDTDNPNKNIFAPDFPINKVIDEIKKYIPSDKKICPGFYEDIYTFKYDCCGRADNRIVDYIKIVCFNNTNEFITMLPIENGEYLPYIDLNYLIEDNKKIKKLSQIDKFNRRYNR